MLPERLTKLTRLLGRLPGVGEKTAQRFVLHLVASDPELGRLLGGELCALGEHLRPCVGCGHIAEISSDGAPTRCGICKDQRRRNGTLCVVARVQDLLAVERSGAMRGLYFVLGRLLSPLEGTGPDDLPLERLRERISEAQIHEVLLATPPTVDGEATALLIVRELSSLGVRFTRIASGIPHGGDLEFADQITVGRAIEGRLDVGRK